MLSIVMDNYPEGWTNVVYKKFKPDEESDSDSETDEPVISGYKKERYKKIVHTEELLPE